jgi:3-methyladenine DNA glycosylase AlkD
MIRKRLDAWADSGHLWRERAAVVATLALIRRGDLDETFRLAARFRDHPHALIHKATGWMLREAGRRDMEALRAFLAKWTPELPRTTLRYAIEHMTLEERGRWMAVPSKRKRGR